MNKFQTIISLLLTSTDAFQANSVDVTRWRSDMYCANAGTRGVDSSRILTQKIQSKILLYESSNSEVSTQQRLSSPKKKYTDIKNATMIEPTDINDENPYVRFAKEYPFMNNFIIATLKTCAADLLAQTVIAHTPLFELDLQRSLLFCTFGGLYSGAFQYLYQVQVFKKLFDVEKFTSQSWSEKLRDTPGVKALAAQTSLDLTILTLVYLPAFYIFKASVFSGSSDPSEWFSTGVDTYATNFGKDEADLLKVWLPADLICFSVPLYLRMPVRQSVSFLWTVYLSFARGGH